MLLDGHSTRTSERAKAAFRQANVTDVIIPPHTSHIIQPLDRGVNLSFKQHLKNYITYQHEGGIPGQRRMLIRAAVKAASAALNPVTITDCFAETGFVPWNPKLIMGDETKIIDDSVAPTHLSPPRSRGAAVTNTAGLRFQTINVPLQSGPPSS